MPQNTSTFPNYILTLFRNNLQGVVSSGPLKNVEIDFLKIDLINFVCDTTFFIAESFCTNKMGMFEKKLVANRLRFDRVMNFFVVT